MFGRIETLSLLPETAAAFGVVKSAASRKKPYTFQPASVEETDGEVVITGTLDEKVVALHYPKDALTDKQRVFVAWIYLILNRTLDWKERDKYKDVAASRGCYPRPSVWVRTAQKPRSCKGYWRNLLQKS